MISSSRKIEIIRSVRTFCIKKYETDHKIPDESMIENRLGIDLATDDLEATLSYMRGTQKSAPIVSTVKTIRLLKLVLRRTIKTWGSLHGEVNFDELFIYNVLRYCAPEAHGFLSRFFREIRALKNDDKGDRKKVLQQRWDSITEDVEWDKNDIEDLIAILFPMWRGSRVTSQYLQTVAINDPTDYWIRMTIENISDNEISDQSFLQAIDDLKANRKNLNVGLKSLNSVLYAKVQFSKKCVQFENIFDHDNLRFLAELLFKEMLVKDGVQADACNSFLSSLDRTKPQINASESFLNLWRISLNKRKEPQEYYDWVFEEITKALSVSLRFANALYYYWRLFDNHSARVKSKEQFSNLRDQIIDKAKQLYSNYAELSKVIDPNWIYGFTHFVILYDSEAEGGSGLDPQRWTWLVTILVEGLRNVPELFAPQVIGLIFKSDRILREFHYEINIEIASKLFGDELPFVMKSISKADHYDYLNKGNLAIVSSVSDLAKEWVLKNTNN
nr:hypothetical protein [uncultured Desulfobacter sp.]